MFDFLLSHLYIFGLLKIIGSRGPIEINPRLTMGKDSDIRGMALFVSDVVSTSPRFVYQMDSMCFTPNAKRCKIPGDTSSGRETEQYP